VRISLEIGHTWPLHAGALAKALLAFMPDRDIVLAQPLARLRPNTVTDPARLLEELEAIRRQGWARSQEETDVGVWGVAAAVLDAHGLPVAGIGLISPLERMAEDYEQRLVEQLARAVGAARGRLGIAAADDEGRPDRAPFAEAGVAAGL
jgi:DNA-binding IclR family transcriptional regulator